MSRLSSCICKHPDPGWCIATETQQENPQWDKNHVIRRSDDVLQSAAQYNDKAKLGSDHEQEPEFSRNTETVRVDAIFDMSADSKQNEENHKTVKDQKRDKDNEPKPVRFLIQTNDQEDQK